MENEKISKEELLTFLSNEADKIFVNSLMNAGQQNLIIALNHHFKLGIKVKADKIIFPDGMEIE